MIVIDGSGAGLLPPTATPISGAGALLGTSADASPSRRLGTGWPVS